MSFGSSNSKRSTIELIGKLIIGLIIAGFLAGIFAVLVARLPESNNNNNNEEKLLKLLIESNENLAKLQRQHETQLEEKREIQLEKLREQEHLDHIANQIFQKNLTYRFLHRIEQINEQTQEEQQAHQWILEQHRQTIADQYRREDQHRQSEHDLYEFFDKTDLHNSTKASLQRKILSLTRSLTTSHKTILVKTLYEEKILHEQCNAGETLACKVDLTGADFSGIQLGKSNEVTCPAGDYKGLYLPGTNLVDASFDCLSLDGAHLMMANLSNASFSRSHLYNATLFSSTMYRCNFDETNMDEVFFSRTSILNARFQRASLIGTRWLFVQGNESDFRQANLAKGIWLEGMLPNAKFDYANISGIFFGNSYLTNASFYKAFGANTRFPSTDITNTSFREASLPLSEFYSTKGRGADLSNAILTESNFRFTELDDCLFSNAKMENSSFFGAQITNADFRYASLVGCDFAAAVLNNSDFSHANFRGAIQLTNDLLKNIFSISDAILPNGTRGENRNLVQYAHPICGNTTMVMNTSEWIVSPQGALVIGNHSDTNGCAFRSEISTMTNMSQSIDIKHYVKRMIDAGPTNILIKIELLFGQIKANLRLFDEHDVLVDEVLGLFDDTSNRYISALHRITDSTISYVNLQIVFRAINTTIDNIHLSIEVESDILRKKS